MGCREVARVKDRCADETVRSLKLSSPLTLLMMEQGEELIGISSADDPTTVNPVGRGSSASAPNLLELNLVKV